MPLNYSSLSANILSTYLDQKNNLILDNEKQTPYPAPPGTEWMDNYVTNYDQDALSGVFSLPAVIMVSNPGLLRFSYTPRPTTMATQLASYWSSQLTPGAPQFCSSIVSVTNDAAKIEAPIRSYLLGSYNGSELTPHYEHLFQFIESQVKSIIWTISESSKDCSKTYTVTIS
jgi:hypothetical protein